MADKKMFVSHKLTKLKHKNYGPVSIGEFTIASNSV